MKVCIEQGCAYRTEGTRCHHHQRQRDRARGTRQQRGYDSDHDRLRAQWQRRLDAGERVLCWRCVRQGTETVIDSSHWDLGHHDDRNGYAGPECVPCNRATAGRIS